MKDQHKLLPPNLTNNPSWDVIVTQKTPLLSFFNSQGGPLKKHYEIQLDTSKNFDSSNLIVYPQVPQKEEFVTDKKVEEKDALKDNSLYYWRARTITSHGKSHWKVSRFYVDTKSDKEFMNLVRVPIRNIEVSAGYNAKNIIDLDDPGLTTFWQSPPPGDKHSWIKFDLGKETEVSRAWILSNPGNSDGWLKDFVIQTSKEGKKWSDVSDTKVNNNDTFRNIINFEPIKSRFFRLLIKDFIGYTAQVNEVILYSPGKPPIPKVPQSNYVLIIGNEHNGYTFTDLAGHIKSLDLSLQIVTVPYYEASLQMLENLSLKPVAIILSGNNADYPNLPMFEYNGEFEIIRNSHIPILGICAGHQFLAMAYGYTRARSMGWSDITAMEPKRKWTHAKILTKDPVFKNIRNNFVAPEIHGWAVAEPALGFEVIAASSYIQAQKNTKRFIYGGQFHAEINASYNHGRPFIKNFLRLAMEKGK